jgi:hypothetical protein
MFFSTCKWIIISFILIILVHYIYLFLMNTLTVPKIKDLVNKPTEQYKDMFASIQTKRADHGAAMTNELTAFLNDLKRDTSAAGSSAAGSSASAVMTSGAGTSVSAAGPNASAQESIVGTSMGGGSFGAYSDY